MKLLTVVPMIVVMFAVAGPVSAQTTRAAAPRETDPIAALTAEFRALRAELAETARASLRLQLLVARVQAQEQRIIYLDRQRAEAATRRASVEQGLASFAARVQQLVAGAANPDPAMPADQRRDLERAAAAEKRQLALQETRLSETRLEESDAVNALAQEQGRWADLSARLDELERSLGR